MKFLAVMVYNAIMIVCLTKLAITFDRWWIVLFAYILLLKIETHKYE